MLYNYPYFNKVKDRKVPFRYWIISSTSTFQKLLHTEAKIIFCHCSWNKCKTIIELYLRCFYPDSHKTIAAFSHLVLACYFNKLTISKYLECIDFDCVSHQISRPAFQVTSQKIIKTPPSQIPLPRSKWEYHTKSKSTLIPSGGSKTKLLLQNGRVIWKPQDLKTRQEGLTYIFLNEVLLLWL